MSASDSRHDPVSSTGQAISDRVWGYLEPLLSGGTGKVGRQAFDNRGDDLTMALTRKIVSGEEAEAETGETVFAAARAAESVAAELLVDDGWKLVEPAAVEVNGLPRTGYGATDTTTKPTSRSGRCSPGPSSWPRSRSSRRAARASRSPQPSRCSSGQWSLSGRRSRSASNADRRDTGEVVAHRATASPARRCMRPFLRFRPLRSRRLSP